MKKITEKVAHQASNAWGRDQRFESQEFVVEKSDVGHLRPHFGGFNHATHQMRQSDVGRIVIVYTDGSGWTNWIFNG